MKEKFLMFMVLLWLVGTVMSLIMAGAWIGDDQSQIMNRLMIMKVQKIGAWSVPVPNPQFFVGDENGPGGIAAVMNWDFSFLQGSFLLWILYLLNIGLAFVLLAMFVGVITSVLT